MGEDNNSCRLGWAIAYPSYLLNQKSNSNPRFEIRNSFTINIR
jgi:hypothetical protein